MEHIGSLDDLHTAVKHAESALVHLTADYVEADAQTTIWMNRANGLYRAVQAARAIRDQAREELRVAERYFTAPLSELDAEAAVEAASAVVTPCYACGCSVDDHRLGEAFERLVAEDNGARRDGPNPCLDCGACERDLRVED